MAHYLIRFDDLCPTMNHAGWERCEALMRRFSIRPILAVVPENRDSDLAVDAKDPAFWNHVRSLQDAGWTIALHGWRHECRSKGKSLVPLHRFSEFAGVPAQQQVSMLEDGLRSLRARGIHPTVWAAPRHGFDRNTLDGLKKVGIHTVSDGLSRLPFCEDGIFRVPQQLFGPQEMPAGVWTICLHTNTLTDEGFGALSSFVERHVPEFLSLEEVKKRWGARRKQASDALEETLWLWNYRGRRLIGGGPRMARKWHER